MEEKKFAEIFNKDTTPLIAMKLDPKSFINFCISDKLFYKWIRDNEKIWEQKSARDFPFLLKNKNKNQTWRNYYVKIVLWNDKIEKKFGIPYISTPGYIPELFYRQVGNANQKIALKWAIGYAAEGGHMDIVNLLISKGVTDFNNVMRYAGKGGHINIVESMMKRGANDYNQTMIFAARGGHIDVVKLMISKGATHFFQAMIQAIEGEHTDVINLLKEKGNINVDEVKEHISNLRSSGYYF